MTLPNRDRVEELIAKESEHLSRGEAALAEITHPLERAMLQAGIAHKRDLLSILYDYARQDKEDKAGATDRDESGVKLGLTAAEGSTPSPGSLSAEDEAALKLIGDAASYLMPRQQAKVQEGLFHLRSRLASPPQRVSREVLLKWSREISWRAPNRVLRQLIEMLAEARIAVEDK